MIKLKNILGNNVMFYHFVFTIMTYYSKLLNHIIKMKNILIQFN